MLGQFLATSLLVGASGTTPNDCFDGSKFLCENIPTVITNMYGYRGPKYLMSAKSNGKGLELASEFENKGLAQFYFEKSGSKYRLRTKKSASDGRKYVRHQHNSEGVDLWNQNSGDTDWDVQYDSHNRIKLHTNANDANFALLRNDTTQDEAAEDVKLGVDITGAKGKNVLIVEDRSADLKLMHAGDSDREWWRVEPAGCAVLSGDDVTGEWVHIGDITHSLKHDWGFGFKFDGHAKFDAELQLKMKASMKTGFKVGPAKVKVHASASFNAALEFAFDGDVMGGKKDSYSVSWSDHDVGRKLWQWQVTSKPKGLGGCDGKTVTVKTQFAFTNQKDKPCCLPGRGEFGKSGKSDYVKCSNDDKIPKASCSSSDDLLV